MTAPATTAARPPARPATRPLMAWGTPVFQADFEGAGQYNPRLRQLILDAEETDPDAALFGGINAVKSSQNLLTWDRSGDQRGCGPGSPTP